jgi:serine/threonine-protein kinase
VHIVVVVDELDKLTSDDLGVASLNEILPTLKNVLTAAGLHTLFVGGTELLDRYAADAHHGIGIFESIFSWTAYVPCLWRSPQELLAGIVADADPWTTTFGQYLQYRTRGIPRRLLQEVNGHVRWRDERPVIVTAAQDQDKIHLYADLAASVESYLGDHMGEGHSSLEDDRFRLGAYYLLDWVLRSEGGVFDAKQVIDDIIERRGNAYSVLPASAPVVAAFLDHLSDAMVLDRVSPETPYMTMGSASKLEQLPRYRLSGSVRERLMRIARTNQRERLMLLGLPPATTKPPPPDLAVARPGTVRRAAGPEDPSADTMVSVDGRPGPGDAADAAPDFAVPRAERRLADGRYELLDMLSVGGMSTVYLGLVAATGERVKVKVLRPSAAGDEEIRRRFLREAEAGAGVRHPNIARIRELVSEPDRLAIVMDYVPGEPLDKAITGDHPIPASTSVAICAKLLAAVQHLHDHGLYRLDIKPHNVVLRPDGDPVIIDLGLAKQVDATAVTTTHALVGTAAYMAPEQIAQGTADHRSDLFSVGVVLFELLSGTRLSIGSDLTEILHRRTDEDLPLDQLRCSPELRAVLARMTARDAERRYATAEAARRELLNTPEAGGTAPAPVATAERLASLDWLDD